MPQGWPSLVFLAWSRRQSARDARPVLDELIRSVFVSIWGPDRYEYDRTRTAGMSIAPDAIEPA